MLCRPCSTPSAAEFTSRLSREARATTGEAETAMKPKENAAAARAKNLNCMLECV